jgi:hypothetical protein
MSELAAIVPEVVDVLSTSNIGHWPDLLFAVLTAIASKASGGIYRMRETRREQPEDAEYVRKREIDNLLIVGMITLLTQVMAFKPAVAFVKRTWPHLLKINPKNPAEKILDKNVEAAIRMALFAPGLFISEKLSRVWAGQKQHDELMRFNHKITHNWQTLINSTQGQSLLNLAYDAPAGQPPLVYTAKPLNLTSGVDQPAKDVYGAKPITPPTSPPDLPMQKTPEANPKAPITPEHLRSALGAVPSPVSFQPQSSAMAGVLKTF